jgi:hypothetical protein
MIERHIPHNRIDGLRSNDRKRTSRSPTEFMEVPLPQSG